MTIRWADHVVGVHVVTPGESWSLGKPIDGDLDRSPNTAGAESGIESHPLVHTGPDGGLRVEPPPDSSIQLTKRPWGPATPNAGALARPLASGPIAVTSSRTIVVTAGALMIEIDGVAPCTEGWRHTLSGWIGGSSPHVAASALAHVALLAFVAYSTPALGAAYGHELSEEQRATLLHYVGSLAQPELEPGPARIDRVARAGGTGQRAAGPEGAMGDPGAAATKRSAANRWRGRDTMPAVPTSAAGRGTDSGAGFGMAGLLLGRDGIGATEPSALWGLPGSQGNGLDGARGNLWGGPMGRSAGAGGLGLSGIGEGGGGRGAGIGIGQVGTIGRGAGTGRGAGLGRSHQARPPRVRCGYSLETDTELAASAAIAERDDAEMSCTAWSTEEPGRCTSWQVSGPCANSVSGRLPPERVQQVMRQNHGRFRLCYQRGLQTDPALQGRVVTRFTIRRDGSVSGVTAQGDLPDPQVTACIASAVSGLEFPRPAGGVVTITYPLVLSPTD